MLSSWDSGTKETKPLHLKCSQIARKAITEVWLLILNENLLKLDILIK